VSESYDLLQTEFEGHRRVPERAIVVAPHSREVRYGWSAQDPSDSPDMEAIQRAIAGTPVASGESA
jgi:hypothetical protein